jgi:hypothetical protein
MTTISAMRKVRTIDFKLSKPTYAFEAEICL